MQEIKSIFRKSTKNDRFIATQEGYTVEYKQSFNWSGMCDYSRAMASMANRSGGYIIFGIKDKPHELIGLDKKVLARFEEKDLAKWSEYIRATFEPTIEFDKFLFEYDGNYYGVIRVYEAKAKPIICKKYVEGKLREGAIYYRYKAENKEIQYAELRKIIDEEERKINALWMEKIKQIGLAGVSNTMILDTQGGILSGNGKSFYIGKQLLDKVRFVDKGRFVETDGEPVFQIIGEVQTVGESPISVEIQDKEIALTDNRIIEIFLAREYVSDKKEFVKHILTTSSRNLPFLFLFQTSNIDDIVAELQQIVGNESSYNKILERLTVKESYYCVELKNTGSYAWKKKSEYKQLLLQGQDVIMNEDIIYMLQSIRSIDMEKIISRKEYFYTLLMKIYSNLYQRQDTNFRSEFKKAVCYLDEVIYRKGKNN